MIALADTLSAHERGTHQCVQIWSRTLHLMKKLETGQNSTCIRSRVKPAVVHNVPNSPEQATPSRVCPVHMRVSNVKLQRPC